MGLFYHHASLSGSSTNFYSVLFLVSRKWGAPVTLQLHIGNSYLGDHMCFGRQHDHGGSHHPLSHKRHNT